MTKPIIIICFLFLSKSIFAQVENPKSIKPGYAIHIGAGFMFGGNIGILVEDQILLKEKIRISPFISCGIAEGGTDSISGKKYFWFGYAVGSNLEYGKKHRIFFGPHLVGNNLLGSSVEVKKNFIVGLSLIFGYKGTANCGLIWQVYAGDIYKQDEYSDSKKFSHSSQVGLGFGYKF